MTVIGGGVTRRGISALVLDDVEPLRPELREVVQHAFEHVGVVALPALQLCSSAATRTGWWVR